MFEAFILGFWIIWSSGRNVRAVSEGLGFTIIAILVRQLSAFDMPMIDTYWMVFNGALWAFASTVFLYRRTLQRQLYDFLRIRRHCRRRLFPTAPTPAQMGAQLAGVTPALPVSMI